MDVHNKGPVSAAEERERQREGRRERERQRERGGVEGDRGRVKVREEDRWTVEDHGGQGGKTECEIIGEKEKERERGRR